MDDERLKRGGSVLSDRYFEEQFQRVREIRLSERKFYQMISDIYATSVDYDLTAQATKRLFASVQNKLHLAIHGQTAAEVIVDRADATKEYMGLHTWTDAPHGKIQKFDVVVAKNYLTEPELAQLSRLVNAYLDVAEDMALRKLPMTMQDWETRLNRFLAATDREVLQDAGKVTDEIARAHAESEFEKYRIVQDRLFESDFDRVVAETKRLGEGTPRKGGRSRDPRAGPHLGVQQSRAPPRRAGPRARCCPRLGHAPDQGDWRAWRRRGHSLGQRPSRPAKRQRPRSAKTGSAVQRSRFLAPHWPERRARMFTQAAYFGPDSCARRTLR